LTVDKQNKGFNSRRAERDSMRVATRMLPTGVSYFPQSRLKRIPASEIHHIPTSGDNHDDARPELTRSRTDVGDQSHHLTGKTKPRNRNQTDLPA
jgi:hypothetical protein